MIARRILLRWTYRKEKGPGELRKIGEICTLYFLGTHRFPPARLFQLEDTATRSSYEIADYEIADLKLGHYTITAVSPLTEY